MYDACLSLPENRREAALIADQLESLARALRDWPTDAWSQVTARPPEKSGESLFERLVAKTAPVAVDPSGRARALASAESVAAVLRILWPAESPLASAGAASPEIERELAPA